MSLPLFGMDSDSNEIDSPKKKKPSLSHSSDTSGSDLSRSSNDLFKVDDGKSESTVATAPKKHRGRPPKCPPVNPPPRGSCKREVNDGTAKTKASAGPRASSGMDYDSKKINNPKKKKPSLSHSSDTRGSDQSRSSNDRFKADDGKSGDEEQRRIQSLLALQHLPIHHLLSVNRILCKMFKAEATPEFSYKLKKMTEVVRDSPWGHEVVAGERFLPNVFRIDLDMVAKIVEILKEKPTQFTDADFNFYS